MHQSTFVENVETLRAQAGNNERVEKASRWNISPRYLAGALGLILVLVLGGLAGSFLTYKTGNSPFGPASTTPLFVSADNNRSASLTPLAVGFAPIVKTALPAVVNISSSRTVKQDASPFMNDPFFRQFFGDQFNVPRERREQSLGSGVIVSPDGYILTNNHVVEGSNDVKIFLSDKREMKARIVGTDPQLDIAVLKVDAKDLPVLTLGDSSKVQVGDISLAIGNPFGLGQTVTMGIVSAIGRGNLGIEDYEDFIQTDAAINPGNSGGALIDSRGDLIGINTAILANGSQGNQGVGFAIPFNMARSAMEQIIKNGKVVRGWLGVSIQEVTAPMAKSFGLDKRRGALVGEVTPDSPASRAGLQRGDIITALNGEDVPDSRELRLRVAALAPGTRVSLKVFREGHERELSVTLGELQGEARAANPAASHSGALRGLSVDDLTPQVARQLGITAQAHGVVVVDVQPNTPASDAGIRRGDVIQEINQKPVGTVSEFDRAAAQADQSGSALLLIDRGGHTFYVAVESK
jgi:serine protease Do